MMTNTKTREGGREMADRPLIHSYPRSPSPIPPINLPLIDRDRDRHQHRRSPSPESKPRLSLSEDDDEDQARPSRSPTLVNGEAGPPNKGGGAGASTGTGSLGGVFDAVLGNSTRPPGATEHAVPIPWRTIVPLLFFCAADAMTYAIVFPWVVDMITSFHVPQDRIGLYGGMAEGIMMLVEAACATTWAKLADKYGRRPCLLLGFGFPVLAMPLLGFAGAVWQVILFRALLGLGPGGVIVKICAAELSHPSNRSTIFSILSPAFGSGFLLGTFLGGELAHPYGRLPSWLGGSIKLFENSPYALPCLVTFGVDIVALLGGYIYLPETQRPSKAHEEGFGESLEGGGGRKRNVFTQTLKVPTFVLSVAVACLFQVSYFSWDGMFTIFTYSTTDKGGLGLPVDMIGILYSLGSSLSLVMQPLFLTRFSNAFGVRKALTIVLSSWTCLALFIPLAQWSAVHFRFLMWVAVGAILALRTFGNFAWAMTDILLVNAFDDYPDLMATGSAISLIATAAGRAFGPALAGWLFSISTQFPAGSMGRQTSWVYLTAATMPAVFLTRFLPSDGAAGHRPSKSEYEQVPLVESGLGLADMRAGQRDSLDLDLELDGEGKVAEDKVEHGHGYPYKYSDGRQEVEGHATGVSLHYEENEEMERHPTAAGVGKA